MECMRRVCIARDKKGTKHGTRDTRWRGWTTIRYRKRVLLFPSSRWRPASHAQNSPPPTHPPSGEAHPTGVWAARAGTRLSGLVHPARSIHHTPAHVYACVLYTINKTLVPHCACADGICMHALIII